MSFAVRLIKLFETSSRFVRLRIRAPIGRVLRRRLKSIICTSLNQRERGPGLRLRVYWFENILLASYLFLRITADICTSVFADVRNELLSKAHALYTNASFPRLPGYYCLQSLEPSNLPFSAITFPSLAMIDSLLSQA